VGLERLASGTALAMMERSFPSQLVPNRDPGIQLHGDLAGDRISYAAGVFSGGPDGGTSDVDTDDNKEFEGRIFSHPLRGSGQALLEGLGIGIGGTYGAIEGDTAASNVPRYTTSGQRTIFQYRPDVFADGVHHRVAPQAYYYYGPLGLLSEYTVSVQDVLRGASARTFKNMAWQIATSFVLTGEKASYNSITPAVNFNPSQGAWGAFELTARYASLRVDRGAFPEFADPERFARKAGAWTLGVNWYLNRNMRLMFNYEQTDFTEASENVSLDKEKVFLQRFQLKF
jgi:phosphate-selective porin OprO/OprP